MFFNFQRYCSSAAMLMLNSAGMEKLFADYNRFSNNLLRRVDFGSLLALDMEICCFTGRKTQYSAM